MENVKSKENKGKRQCLEAWETEESLNVVRSWARRGLTQAQIASNIGIGMKTYYNWIKTSSLFSSALKTARDYADAQVENALFNSAIGFETWEEQVTRDGDIVTVKKMIPPSTTAQIFYLKNRMPNDYRDVRKHLDETNNNGVSQELNDAIANVIEVIGNAKPKTD